MPRDPLKKDGGPLVHPVKVSFLHDPICTCMCMYIDFSISLHPFLSF